MKRKYDLQNDTELNDASWEAGKGAMVGAATVRTSRFSYVQTSYVSSVLCSSLFYLFKINLLHFHLHSLEKSAFEQLDWSVLPKHRIRKMICIPDFLKAIELRWGLQGFSKLKKKTTKILRVLISIEKPSTVIERLKILHYHSVSLHHSLSFTSNHLYSSNQICHTFSLSHKPRTLLKSPSGVSTPL